MIYDREAEIS